MRAERTPKTPRSISGLFAALSTLLHAKGSSRPIRRAVPSQAERILPTVGQAGGGKVGEITANPPRTFPTQARDAAGARAPRTAGNARTLLTPPLSQRAFRRAAAGGPASLLMANPAPSLDRRGPVIGAAFSMPTNTGQESTTQNPSAATGFRATVRGLLGFAGIRMPKTARGSGASSARRPIFLAAVVSVLVVLLPTAGADAAQTRVLQGTFGCEAGPACTTSAPAGATLSKPQGIAVNNTSGDIYVADTGNNRVEKFNEKGEFLLMFGGDVNKTPGGMPSEKNVCEAGEECQPGAKASTPGAFEHAQFLAIDQSTGDVYVADTADNTVSKFSAEGVLEESSWGVKGQLSGGCENPGESAPCSGSTSKAVVPFGSIAGIAVGPAGSPSPGTLYVLNLGDEVFEFDAGGGFSAEVGLHGEFTRSALGLGVNAAGELFANSEGEQIEEFTPAGGLIGFVRFGHEGPLTVAANGDLYFPESGTLDHDRFNGLGEVLLPGGGSCAPTPSSACEVSDSTSVGFEGSGIAATSAGEVFLSNGKEGKAYQYSGLLTVPGPETGEAKPVEATTATLNAEVNPAGLAVKKCEFEYVEAAKYEPAASDPYAAGLTAPCVPLPAGTGTSPVPVSAEISGLTPGTTYDYRLVAANENDENEPQPGENKELKTLPLPSIDSATVTALTATSATLNAQINPQKFATHYHFEYDTSPYTSSAPQGTSVAEGEHGEVVKEGSLPAVEADVLVPPQNIAGLSANTQYYWRVVATSTTGTTTSVQHTFIYETKGAGLDAGALPDNRAYEIVTPNRKNGALIGDVSFIGGFPSIAASGERVIASAIQCFAGAQSCNAQHNNVIGSPYELTRSGVAGVCAPAAPPCWHTTPLAPPATELPNSSERAFSAEGEGAALFSIPTTAPPLSEGEDDFYVREPSGKFVDLGPNTPPEDGAVGPLGGTADAAFQASSTDLSHFVWDATYPWSFPFEYKTEGTDELFEYAPGAANRHLDVGVSGSYKNGANHNLISDCGTTLGAAGSNKGSQGAMSADGQTVFFTALPTGATAGGAPCGEVLVPEVFARVDGEVGPEESQQLGVSEAHTVALSEPQALDQGERKECKSTPCKENTSLANKSTDWRGAEFNGASEDGSDAFFTSTQQLTDSATEDSGTHKNGEHEEQVPDNAAEGCTITEGANGCNLYLFEGVTMEHASERHLVDVSAGENGAPVPNGPRVQGVVAISADGSHVYFVAQGVLTEAERPGCLAEWDAAGRTTESHTCKAEEGEDNLYVFDTETARTSFVTIMSENDIPEWNKAPGLPANVTPDGQFMVFVSHGDLTADDTSRSGAQQVFRYDAGSGGASSLTRMSIGNERFDDDGNRSAPTPCKVHEGAGGACSEDAHIVNGLLGAPRTDPTMSEDGSRVFFESPVELTPHALDDVQIGVTQGENEPIPVYAMNVYEWESGGAGSCEAAAGCVFLINDGRDVSVNLGATNGCTASSVCLLGTDTTGDNVFFATADQLVSSDTNTELDYYDARVCEPENGNPCVSSPPPSSTCSGEECHGIPAGVPGVPAAPSTTFSGPGNFQPAVTPKSLTRAQKLANALKSCKKDKNKKKRATCEKTARKKYGPIVTKKKAKKAGHNRRAK
jgi:DNA-binding beta-propeller fold protein YncE